MFLFYSYYFLSIIFVNLIMYIISHTIDHRTRSFNQERSTVEGDGKGEGEGEG